MTNHYREAENAEEIAKLLRSRGRMIITAPARCGKTTELLKYAEERYPNGRFAIVVAREENREKIIRAHWKVYNNISYVDAIAKRLLGQDLEGEEVNEPTILVSPQTIYLPNQFIPLFADDFYMLPRSAQRGILKHKLFIAAVGTQTGDNDAENEI